MAPVVKQETGVDPGASSTPGSSSRLSRADSEYQVADPGAGGYDEAEGLATAERIDPPRSQPLPGALPGALG